MVHVEIKSKIGRYTVIYSTARDAASSLRWWIVASAVQRISSEENLQWEHKNSKRKCIQFKLINEMWYCFVLFCCCFFFKPTGRPQQIENYANGMQIAAFLLALLIIMWSANVTGPIRKDSSEHKTTSSVMLIFYHWCCSCQRGCYRMASRRGLLLDLENKTQEFQMHWMCRFIWDFFFFPPPLIRTGSKCGLHFGWFTFDH